jgi:hypothetical protein
MPSRKSQLRLTCAFAALAALSLAVSCRGFFVNPTLTSLAVGPPNLTLAPATSYQMVATGTYSDGSTRNVTGQSLWNSTNPSAAFFSTTVIGQLNAVSLQNLTVLPGTTTVSASDGTVASSTQTVNVCPSVQSLAITVNQSSSGATVAGGATLTFTAMATFSSITGTQNVVASVTWNISNTSVISSIPTSGITTANTGFASQPTTVYATLCGATSNTVTVTTTS